MAAQNRFSIGAGNARRSTLLALAISAWAGASWAQVGYERGVAAVHRADASRPLASANGQSMALAAGAALGARGRDAQTLAATRHVHTRSGRNGSAHAEMLQTVEGLTVHGAYARAAFDRNGNLVHLIDKLAAVPAAPLAAARVDALQALRAVVSQLHPGAAVTLRHQGVSGNTVRFDGGRYFWSEPTVEAVAIAHADGRMARGWLVQTWSRRDNQLHHTLVGGDGQVLEVESRTNSDSYRVFPVDPGKGAAVVVAGPGAGNAESPAGWLGTGAQSTLAISGNNTSTYLDADANDAADSGGTAVAGGDFLATPNLSVNPNTATNRAVAVQNLFYLTNQVHDILYRHGFTEAAGNFQINNFGKGGAGNDPVNAEAQDGSGLDNANFATPPDGQRPRMQMYLWTGPGPTHEVTRQPSGPTYNAMGASFGAQLSTTGITGTTQIGSPADGCGRMNKAVAGKVAVIARGTCDFTVKVRNAQSAGAIGVIVTNNVAGDAFTMGGTDARVTIPSVMLNLTDGNAVRAAVAIPVRINGKPVLPLPVDGDLDSDIVYHEYGHGLTWRMIGNMSGAVAGAIGEGMGDGLAMLINGDPVVGEYSASNSLGIRRHRYDTYPLTYANFTGAEVHDDGEIYAAIVWRMIELFGPTRRDTLFSYVVDGMNFTPAAPSFEAMRDGILASVAAAPADPGDACLVWRAFAKYGVGVGSSLSIRRGVPTVRTSFTTAAGCPAP